jgi:hypothetical protein
MKIDEYATQRTTEIQREIGYYTQGKPGRHVVFLGGVHGNEPSGVIALEKVLKDLKNLNIPFNGTLTALRGNLPALAERKRYIDKDLNRIWNTGHTKVNGLDASTSEWNEKKELTEKFRDIVYGNQIPIFIDLHTTSAEGAPFMAIGDTIRNRKLTENIPTPVILGFEEHMIGTLFNFFNYLGVCSMLFEGGQHDSLAAIKNHTAFIWMVLINTGCIQKEDLKAYKKYYSWLLKGARGKSSIYETVFRYQVKEREQFKMDPGYLNFQPVSRDTEVATYEKDRVRASYNGNIFMPLYQEQGEDGFFVIRKVRPFWIRLSGKLRKLKMENSLHLLPGIIAHNELENTFLIDRRVAFLLPRQFFHLFGYKKLFLGNNKLVMARRKFDLEAPTLEEIQTEFQKLLEIN